MFGDKPIHDVRRHQTMGRPCGAGSKRSDASLSRLTDDGHQDADENLQYGSRATNFLPLRGDG